MEGRCDGAAERAEDCGGAQEQVKKAGNKAAEYERKTGGVDGEEMDEDRVRGCGALGGVGVWQEMSKGMQGVHGPDDKRSGEEKESGEES